MFKRSLKIITLLTVFCILFCAALGCSQNTPLDENSEISNVVDNPTGDTDSTKDNSDPSDKNENTLQSLHKHSLEYHKAIDATCISPGNLEYWFCTECEICYADEDAAQEIADVNIAALGHSYTETVIDPTCTEQGYTEYKCRRCDDEYTDTQTSATGHAWAQTKIVDTPTCTEDGLAAIRCSKCGRDSTKTLLASGHDYKETITPPTCIRQGFTAHVCSECGDEYTDSYAEVLGHSYYLEVTKPTCTDGGYSTQKCHRCDVEIAGLYPTLALGHDFTEKITRPTCTDTGLTEKTCNTCGSVVTEEISATGHSYSIEVIDPSCTKCGYTKYSCYNCDYEYTCDEVEATGHRYSDQWSSDEDFHWHEVLCGCDLTVDKVAHTYKDGMCECGQQEPLPYRLTFVSDGDEYTVSGIQVADNVAGGSLDIEIPSEYNGLPVTKIADEAFMNNTKMKSVTIPASVKRIGKNAFLNCSLTSATFKKTGGWKVSKNENGSQATAVTLASATNNAKLLTKNSTNNYAAYYWFCG